MHSSLVSRRVLKGANSALNLLKLTLRSGSTEASRGSYAELTSHNIKHFEDLLGPGGCISDGEALSNHNRDWMNRYRGNSSLALQPNTTQQVSKILAYCNERRLAVVPQAGNSGLSGGSVPLFDEVILLTHKLDKIISFDEVSGILTCQAGCTLKSLTEFAQARGHTIPLDLGAKQCQAGGFVSTNAGGLRYMRYGSLRGRVLGLEVVRADGGVLDLLTPVQKNNTGYDLKQLFIGGEGTLGVITAIALLLPPKSASVHLAYLACHSYEAVQRVMVEAKAQLGEIMSAFEFLDRQALDLTLQVLPAVENPLAGMQSQQAPFYVLIETAGSKSDHDLTKLQDFLASMSKANLTSQSVLKEGEAMAKIWKLRESISVALSTKGPVYKYDLSLPVGQMYDLVEATRERLREHSDAAVVSYGHLNDGNLHLNVSVDSFRQEVLDCIEPFVYEFTSAHRGSVSAEHGVGQMKKDCLHFSKPDDAIEMMGQLKTMFDPKHILNPYKYLPSQYWNHQAG